MISPERNQISDWRDELRRIRNESQWLMEPLTEAQFNWKPGPARWSVGECFDHLSISTRLMLEKAKPELERGRNEGVTGVPPFRYKLMDGWFVAMMEKPPGKRGMPAPANFVPPSGMPKSKVMGEYAAWFAATVAHLRRHLAQAKRVTETEGFPSR